MAGDMVMAGEGVANENGVRLGGIECAVSLINQIVSGQNPAAAQVQRLVEMSAL